MTVLVSFSPSKVAMLMKVFTKRMLGKIKQDYIGVINDIVDLSKANRKGKREFEAAVNKVGHPFLKEGAQILYWAEADIDDDEKECKKQTRAHQPGITNLFRH